MSCFKKDGTIKKIYMDFVPLIESAEPCHNTITVNKTQYDYRCRRFEMPKNRQRSMIARTIMIQIVGKKLLMKRKVQYKGCLGLIISNIQEMTGKFQRN